MRRHEFEPLPDDLITLAIRRALRLRERQNLRKPPATGALLVWLRVLALALPTCPEELDKLKLNDPDALVGRGRRMDTVTLVH